MKEIDHAVMSLRVPPQRWWDKERFGELLGMLGDYPGTADSLALFTAFTHPPVPLETIREHIPALRERITEAHAKGYGCGVNILATMGHHNENLENSFQGDYTRRTDIRGNVCLGSFCPNDEAYVADYVVPLYREIAGAGPDFIWIDDDVRSGHMPIGPDCFCEKCLERFAALCGRKYTRGELARALDCGGVDERLALRKLWLQAKRETVDRLFRAVEGTVHAIDPNIALGFMTGERFADGYGFAAQADILAGPGGGCVLWRPGGGFYRDDTPRDMVEKSHEIGRQASLLPEHVRQIVSEIENFNYEALGKAVHTTALEVASHIAAGCTGAALNVMGVYESISEDKTALFREISARRPFYDALVRAQGRLPAKGIFTGWCAGSEAAGGLSQGWFSGSGRYNPHFADQWFETGLPMAYSPEHADMAMFTGDAPYAFSEKEIQRWLAKGVYLDGPALEALNAMGYGELTGFAVGGYLHADCIEQLTEHPLNGGFAGAMRDGRQSFWKCPCAVLEAAAPGAQALARIVDYGGRMLAGCGMGIFENKLGGRVAVGGYYPWNFVLSRSKAGQCRRVARWLSREALPAFVSSLHRVNLWARETDDGRMALTLLNGSMDAAEGLTLCVRTESETLTVTDMRMNTAAVAASGTDGAYRVFALPAMAPWSICLAVV